MPQAGFIKSSAKVTLIPTTSKLCLIPSWDQSPRTGLPSGLQDAGVRASATPQSSCTWICSICSFSNPVLPGFDSASADSRTRLPTCQNCGIKPSLQIIKAAVSASRQTVQAMAAPTVSSPFPPSLPSELAQTSNVSTGLICSRCTFDNNSHMMQCEMCDAPLVGMSVLRTNVARRDARPSSTGPKLADVWLSDEPTASIKFSFRAGGDKQFYENLKAARLQRAWLLQGASPVPKPAELSIYQNGRSAATHELPKVVGIARLEMRGNAQRKNNATLIGNAFEDLEALMTSAKDIVALAESFSAQAREAGDISAETDSWLMGSASALGLSTTKDMLGSDQLYISELSRNLAEFLTDDNRAVLRKEGGIMSLVDLWAVFNRSRNGVELVSPVDFEKAARMWELLKLPLRLRQFKSGLLVVQGRDWTNEKTIASILAWLREFQNSSPGQNTVGNTCRFGKGVTVQEAAVRFGWSLGVAVEELEMAEERGAICRDQGLDGLRFWENWLTTDPAHM